jgi:hypothetical protein
MSGRSYEIDDQGNLIESGVAAPVDSGQSGQVVTREGVRSVMRAIVLSEVLGVLVLVGVAIYYADMRTLILGVAAAYAVMAVVVTGVIRRSMLKRLGQPIQPD